MVKRRFNSIRMSIFGRIASTPEEILKDKHKLNDCVELTKFLLSTCVHFDHLYVINFIFSHIGLTYIIQNDCRAMCK